MWPAMWNLRSATVSANFLELVLSRTSSFVMWSNGHKDMNNNNNNHNDIYSAVRVIMTEVIVRVHSVHLVNVE